MKTKTSISLIIATYNNPAFLELVLLSVMQQKELPAEVIISDDGSKQETKELIESYQRKFPVPLIHVWHEDTGYRLAAIKNKATAKATGAYIIFIDGDLMLHPRFIYDYQRRLRVNHILVASRVFLSENYTKELAQTKDIHINTAAANIEKNKLASFRVPAMNYIVKGISTYAGARGGLMGVFKSDYIKVNGFNEAFTGWGREDSELFVRLLNSGVKRDNIKFAAITYHLWHPVISRASLPANDALLEKAINEKSSWCEMGINQYL
jgi:glycosyltransferase involved in cell wall biosynthesis